jgi:hypothetical protein
MSDEILDVEDDHPLLPSTPVIASSVWKRADVLDLATFPATRPLSPEFFILPTR